jgi:hypothetical protein
MKISSLQLKVLAAVLFVAANTMNEANAQSTTPASEGIPQIIPQPLKSAVPNMERGHKFILVTSKAPTVKVKCRFDSATADEIRCQQHFHSQPIIYRMADLETVIEPGGRPFDWIPFVVLQAVGGGIITGACFLGAVSAIAILGAVPVALIGGFFLLFSWWAAAESDYTPPTVLYQKPGTTLGVKLQ